MVSGRMDRLTDMPAANTNGLQPDQAAKRDLLIEELVPLSAAIDDRVLAETRQRVGEILEVLIVTYRVSRRDLAAICGVQQGTIDWRRNKAKGLAESARRR